MKHKYMSQDTLLIIFNVWMAAGVVLCFEGHVAGSVVCYAMMLVTLGQLLWSSWQDMNHTPAPPVEPQKEDV